MGEERRVNVDRARECRGETLGALWDGIRVAKDMMCVGLGVIFLFLFFRDELYVWASFPRGIGARQPRGAPVCPALLLFGRQDVI